MSCVTVCCRLVPRKSVINKADIAAAKRSFIPSKKLKKKPVKGKAKDSLKIHSTQQCHFGTVNSDNEGAGANVTLRDKPAMHSDENVCLRNRITFKPAYTDDKRLTNADLSFIYHSKNSGIANENMNNNVVNDGFNPSRVENCDDTLMNIRKLSLTSEASLV